MDKKKILTIAEYELPITIEEEKTGGFFASCPVWEDCYAQADTIEEAINEKSYFASSLNELYKEEEMKIPPVFKFNS